MNKKIIIIIVSVLVIIALIFTVIINLSKPEIKTNKQTIYNLFYNFPESSVIYYTTKNKYTSFSVGPTIYQLYILAELTDDSYNDFINKLDLEKLVKPKIKINPKKLKYNWKNVKNIDIIEPKNNEVANIQNIYLDEKAKTIYITAIGGN